MPSAPENLLLTATRELVPGIVLPYPQKPNLVTATNGFTKDMDIVKIDVDGYISNYFTNKAVAGGSPAANSTIVGIAKEDSTYSSDTDVMRKVALIVPGLTILELPVWHDTPSSAVTSRAYVGRICRLYRHVATGAICVDLNNEPITQEATNNNTYDPQYYHARIVAVSPRYPVGEQYGTYLVTIRSRREDYDTTAKTIVHDLTVL